MALEYRNEQPRYYRYERNRKVYVAAGDAALIAAERDAQRRNELIAIRQRVDHKHSQIVSALNPIHSFAKALDSTCSALLVVTGHYRHCRGPWMRKRQ